MISKNEILSTILKAIILPSVLVLFTFSFVNTAIAGDAIDLATAGIGARSIAMGSAYTAVADDATAILANPAGLGFQKQWGVTNMSANLLNKVDYKVTGVVYPIEFGTIGVGYLSASTPAGYITSDKASISSAQSISYGSNMLLLSWGKDLRLNGEAGKLSVGASVKATSSNFSGLDGSSSGTGMDLGLLYKPTENISGGVSLRNAMGSVNWKGGNQETMPKMVTVGAALNNDKGLVSMDVNLSDNKALLHGGAEYRPLDILVIRAGVDQTAISQDDTVYNLSGGVGLNLNGFSFDYAYKQDYSIVENATHYFSISYQPAMESKKEVAQIPVETKGLLSRNSGNDKQIFDEVLINHPIKVIDTFSSRIENSDILQEVLVN
ncbi:MAG: hypothetical protein WCV91_00870 [Candidatus Margulisiibacteriota bacterium]